MGQGKRRTMEDTHQMIPDLRGSWPLPSLPDAQNGPFAYFGVYDGHGGDRTAKITADELHAKLLHSSHFARGDIKAAILQAFDQVDAGLIAHAQEHSDQSFKDGTTVVLSMVLGQTAYFANLGDSEALIARRIPDVKHFPAYQPV